MYRLIFYTIVLILVTRALTKFWHGMVAGLNGGEAPPRDSRVPQRGVQMVRDPVCGTFVVPERSIALTRAGGTLYFCSTTCRDQYVASRASATIPSEAAHGRTA